MSQFSQGQNPPAGMPRGPQGFGQTPYRVDLGDHPRGAGRAADVEVIRRPAPRASYYGAFFWLSVVSFVVPLFVAARAFQSVAPASKPTPTPDASGVDFALWDYLLKAYGTGGLVDYR
ncbi:MAG: hypothetical protein KGM43_10590, partial [Planctomycetota bacterium]|nr:hypothetical protein [Planctomycetota bacterium]